MPKSIIREIDNSTTGSILSSNFSVLVPGYINPEKDTEKLKNLAKATGIYYEDSKIYVLNSQAVFTKFVGKYGGNKKPVAPEPEILHPELTGIQKYQTQPNIDAVRDYYWNEETVDYKYYVGTSVEITDSDYGKNGYLLKTFTLETGNETYKFIPVKAKALVEELQETGRSETAGVYFKIKNSKVGATNTSVDHIGNQIAYELLGLGYTVYFKVLSTDSPALDQLKDPTFWEPLKQKSVYRIRYLTSGGCYDSNVVKEMQKIAYVNNKKATIEDADVYGKEIGRGDVIVLADIDEDATDIVKATTKRDLLLAFGKEAAKFSDNGEKGKGKFTAVFAPRVAYDFGYSEDDVYSNDQLFPASFHYLACAAYAQERYAEWYAVAGYTRGICGKPIKYLTKTFGDVDVNTLCPRVANDYVKVEGAAINLIITERGNYYLWGNRTAEPLTDKGLIFSHFLNIRQLCCTLKQVLYEATRKFTFEPNSDLLWINFVNAIKPTLEAMKADQGISGYKISRVATDKKALLVAKIRIVPIEAVEDFDISIYLEDSLSGIVVDVDETVAE